MNTSGARRFTAGLLLWPALLALSLIPSVLVFAAQAIGGQDVTLSTPPWKLTLTHLGLVLLASAIVTLSGVPLAVFLTRPGLPRLRALAEAVAGFGQTVPTLALLALAVPALGFGWKPTLLGLILYGFYPVLSSSVTGLMQISPSVLDAADGMGMTPAQRLWQVELPLARPLILAGIRTSTVFNVGTAAIGAALGAGGLGELIINGLSEQNTGMVFAGAWLAALLALSLDRLLDTLTAGRQETGGVAPPPNL